MGFLQTPVEPVRELVVAMVYSLQEGYLKGLVGG
jgi:hypothetical protein